MDKGSDVKNVIQSHFQGNWQQFYGKYLPGIKPAGGQEFKAKCPFHEDNNPSLCFNGDTGAYFCHGCGKKGSALHFYAKVNGLDTGRDFGRVLKGIAQDFGIPWEEKQARLVRAYDYVDASGSLLFQVCRMDPKDFRQRRPNGNGSWAWNLKGVETVLYRLPEVLRTDEVLIVEGEKDADNVADLGLCATTCPMGAKKWKPEYSGHLKGKHVILCPDNDNQGREHMALVGAALKGVAASIKWLELPGLPSKGDISDWLTGFNGDKEAAAERLAVMIENAGPYEPPKIASLEDAILEADRFISVDMPRRRNLLAPWLKEQSISLINGWRGTGKTWFALSLLDAVSRGESFGPWRTEAPVPCLYLEGEMPAQDVADRLRSLNPDPNRKAPLWVYSDAYANHLGLSRANLLSDTWRQSIRRVLLSRGVKLWAVDNLASLASGLDENSKKDWDPVNAWLLELRFAGIATVMLHHTNKAGAQRGTSAREDNIDTSIILKSPFDYVPEDGARFVVNFSKARVGTKDLAAIGDNQFHLREDESGRAVWTWGSVKRETKLEVLRMLDEGADQKTICDTLTLSKGYVSKIRKAAIQEGHLTPQNKLTQAGFTAVREGENEA
ncbi:MAG: AAA family ATPase [Proteobacteria bacterium]|nr:AAA family ATPase [Pseudomonadota bacterium]